jgi:uncharacterized membrane protein
MKILQKLFTTIAFACLLAACNNESKNTTSSTDSSAMVTKPAVDSVALKYTGLYSGYLPCADCAGIMTFLSLSSDMTYRLEETFAGKNDTARRANGIWKRENDKVVLYQGDKVLISYLPEGQKLVQLDIEGKRISGNLGDKYVLSRNQVADNPAWKAKKEAGVDFIGLGNEPFWSLDIDKNGKVNFNTPDMKSPVLIAYGEPVNTQLGREYHLESESAKLDITVIPQYCSDGMSDFTYEYKVTVKHNGRKYSGCGVMLNAL